MRIHHAVRAPSLSLSPSSASLAALSTARLLLWRNLWRQRPSQPADQQGAKANTRGESSFKDHTLKQSGKASRAQQASLGASLSGSSKGIVRGNVEKPSKAEGDCEL
jgi:hypothetical protein